MENPNIFRDDEQKSKIKEYVFAGPGISGNPQRNYALTQISNPDTLLYYLDDDNIIHPDLYRLLNVVECDKMYTFNQHNRLIGNNINVGHIDTAMMLIDYGICKNITWNLHRYDADGVYITDCHNLNKDKYIFVNNTLCYYNKVSC